MFTINQGRVSDSGQARDGPTRARRKSLPVMTRSSLIVPPSLPLPPPDQRRRSRCRLGGGVPGVSYSLPLFARFGVSRGGGTFLPVLRPLSEFGYSVHAGKLPSDQRRSLLTTKGDLETPCGLASGNLASRAAGAGTTECLGRLKCNCGD
jgi:hypothetical protein